VLRSRELPGSTEEITPLPLSIRVGSRQITVYCRPLPSDGRILEEVFIDNSYEYGYEDFLPDVDVVVDLGAHVGLATAWFACRFPGCHLIAVEPSPSNLPLLEKTASSLAERTDVVHAAVSNKEGDAAFYWSDWSSSGSTEVEVACRRQTDTSRAEYRSARRPIRVPLTTVPSLMRRFGLSHIDILKVDVEGAERSIFAGSPEWLAAVRLIVIEVHDRHIDGDSVRRELQAAGFAAVARTARRNEIFVAGHRRDGNETRNRKS
jgi:FkbM family methyltransferase